ncbi:hypothetical protein NKJ90_23250 [Mesorhizobium sp. M0051]|uniref:hypothetical protein n=1 Tax=Mesorhizobium sp. M0051 TaxID=2956862 RepID=UPI00333BED2F
MAKAAQKKPEKKAATRIVPKKKEASGASRTRHLRLRCDCYLFLDKLTAKGLSIDDLDLVDYAKDGAVALLAAYPADVVFTSGRRDIQAQADAMANNVVKDPKWIEKTYKASTQRDQLQKWVDDNPGAKTAAEISAGLYSVMSAWSDAEKEGFSAHFTGKAFDMLPPKNHAEEIEKFIRKLPYFKQLLTKEGGHIIWHVAFEKK